MSDRNLTLLFAQLSGFRVVVLANRLGCDNDLARRAHDALLKELNTVIGFLRQEADAALALVRNPDPAEVVDLMEYRYDAQRSLEDYLCDGPHPLLDYVHIDHATNEWFDDEAGRWRFLADCHPVMNSVSNRALCGLVDIMCQIRRETRLEFSAYLDWKSTAQADEAIFHDEPPAREGRGSFPDTSIDRDDGISHYERLHGPDR